MHPNRATRTRLLSRADVSFVAISLLMQRLSVRSTGESKTPRKQMCVKRAS